MLALKPELFVGVQTSSNKYIIYYYENKIFSINTNIFDQK